MKDIIFVIGPPNSGKTHFITNNLSDFYHIDLFDFQKGKIMAQDSILKSYNDCEKELRAACHKYDKICLEHTLSKSFRRKMWINFVTEELGRNQDVICYYSFPNLNDYIQFDKLDLERCSKKNKNIVLKPMSIETLKRNLTLFEIPNVEEGFSEVICIQDL